MWWSSLNSFFNEYEWKNRTNSICHEFHILHTIHTLTAIEKTKLDIKMENKWSLFDAHRCSCIRIESGMQFSERNIINGNAMASKCDGAKIIYAG